jgi:hypothetical protein
MRQDEATIEKLSRTFVKVSEAVFRITSSSDTLVTVELLSGTEFKFGYQGYATVSDVVPGTLISFRKSAEGCILERQIAAIPDSGAGEREIIKSQFEQIFFLGKEGPGTFSLHLDRRDYTIDKSLDYSKTDKKE